MKLLVAFSLTVMAVGCASPTPTVLPAVLPSPSEPSAHVTPAPLSPPPESATPAPTPLPSAVMAILFNPTNAVRLAPLPEDHTVQVDADTAVLSVLSTYNLTGPATYIDHGLRGGEPVWLVIVKVQDMAPIPVGPACPSPPDGCSQHWAVNDYVVALVSDQTGQFVPGGFTTMREVPAPSPSA